MLISGKKSYDKVSILKAEILLANKGPYSQSYGFSSSHVWMWELDHKESWAWRIYVFKLWCWRRILRIPWTARRSNQSVLKEINPEYSLKGLMLKLQYFGSWCKELTHWKRPWCWERLRAGGEGGDKRMRRLDKTTNSMDKSLSKLRETVRDREAWWTTLHGGHKELDMT